MHYCSNKNNTYGNSILPCLLTTSSCIKDYSLHLSDEDVRLKEFKVICSGSQSKKFLESGSNRSLLPNPGPTIAVFQTLCHDPSAGQKLA